VPNDFTPSPALSTAAGSESHLASCGSVSVAELDWTQPQHYAALSPPPFDYVLAADCIYHETLLRHLYRVMLAITSERSTSEYRVKQQLILHMWPGTCTG
jgi:hypothetical protein